MAAAVSGVTDTATTTKTTTTKTAAEQTQDRFLKLLVAQMQNQDPLNPMDNAAVTTQMAQIQTVQGIQGLNDVLKANTDAQSFQTVGLIGRNVLAPGSFINMAVDSTTGKGAGYAGFELESAADKVTVNVVDSNNQVVRTLNLGKQDAGSTMFAWDGKNDAGTQLASGQYSFVVKATLDDATVNSTKLAVAPVDSVLMSASGPKLNVTGMGLVEMSAVRQVM